jgi:hypothetical protein
MPASAQTRYASALEKQSIKGIPATFGEFARNAWTLAEDDWKAFGNHKFPAHNVLEMQGQYVRQQVQLGHSLNPEIVRKMTDEELIRDLIEGELEKISPEERERLIDNKLTWTERWSNQQNFRYWMDRCAAERDPRGTRARQHFYDGTKAYQAADFLKAVDEYRKGLDLWKTLLDEHVVYRDDELNMLDTGQIVRRYASALRQAGEEVPTTIPFYDLMKLAEGEDAPDPFDELELMGPGAGGAPPASAPAPEPTSPGAETPASAPAAP